MCRGDEASGEDYRAGFACLDVEDLVLMGAEENMIEETLEQKERGKLLKWEEVFGE